MVISGATDGAMFLTYLKDVLVPQPWAGAVMVLDNSAAPSFSLRAGNLGTLAQGEEAAGLFGRGIGTERMPR